MILTIVKSLGSLASSYVDGKVQTQKVKAEIQKKQLTGEIDWDLEAIKATQSSWKDEWITILYPYHSFFVLLMMTQGRWHLLDSKHWNKLQHGIHIVLVW